LSQLFSSVSVASIDTWFKICSELPRLAECAELMH